MKINCTNCGAPIQPGADCRYCGSEAFDNQWLVYTAVIIEHEIAIGLEPAGAVTEANYAERVDRIGAARAAKICNDPVYGVLRTAELLEEGIIDQREADRWLGLLDVQAAPVIELEDLDELLRQNAAFQSAALSNPPQTNYLAWLMMIAAMLTFYFVQL